MRTLKRFGASCVLVSNTVMYVAVPLCDGLAIDPALLHGLIMLRAGERCRYLGVLVGEGRLVQENWSVSGRAERLAGAGPQKANKARSRAELAASLAIPKVMFLAIPL